MRLLKFGSFSYQLIRLLKNSISYFKMQVFFNVYRKNKTNYNNNVCSKTMVNILDKWLRIEPFLGVLLPLLIMRCTYYIFFILINKSNCLFLILGGIVEIIVK